MRREIRKNKNHWTDKDIKRGGAQSSGLKKTIVFIYFKISFVLILISSIFFQSCSHNIVKTRKRVTKTVFEDSLGKICLTGEGRAKLRNKGKKHTVSFESLLSKKDKVWSLSFSIPFQGEELVEVNYKRPYLNRDNYIRQMALFLQFYTTYLKFEKKDKLDTNVIYCTKKIGEYSANGYCLFYKKKLFSWHYHDEKFKIIFPAKKSKRGIFSIELSNSDSEDSLFFNIVNINGSSFGAKLFLTSINCE